MKKIIALLALVAVLWVAFLLTAGSAHAQAPGQNQIIPPGSFGGGVVVSTSSTPTAKLGTQAISYFLARANHTGTQLAATISDFSSAVLALISVTDTSTIDFTLASGNITASVVADSIGNTQLAFNTGQNLTTASSPTFAGLTVTGEDGCAEFSGGVLGSTGSACGSGGGGSGTVTQVNTTYPVLGGPITTTGTLSLAFGTTTANTWGAHNIFGSLFATNASSTNATTSSLYVTGLTSALSLFDANGQATEYAGSTCGANTLPRGLTASGAVSGCASVANADLANSTVSFGGVSLALGASDATPAFDLSDATGLPIVNGTTGTLSVARGGTGSTTLSGLLKGAGTSAITTAVPNTDYQTPIALTTTGTSGAATFDGTTLNIPQYAGTTYTATYPVTLTGSAFGLAFGTTTSNTWAGTQTFGNLVASAATTTALTVGTDYLTDITGSGLNITGNALTLDRTGAWTGTFDGQEGTWYVDRANHTGTQLANTISNFDATVNAYLHASTTLPKTYTANTFTATQTFGTLIASVADFSAGILRMTYTASLSLSTNGDIGIDSTSNQVRYRSNGADRVLGDGNFYPAFSYATSTAWTGTTTLALGTAFVGETWNGVQCFTDTGTLNVRFTDGTNGMNMFNASTTAGTVALSSNNTFTAAEKRYVEVGTPASTPTKISCTVSKSLTAN